MTAPIREPGRTVTLRVLTWAMRGGPPVAPLYLRTNTGRTYQVRTLRKCRPGSEARYVFGAEVVAPADVPEDARVFEWTWRSRRRQ